MQGKKQRRLYPITFTKECSLQQIFMKTNKKKTCWRNSENLSQFIVGYFKR